MRWPITSVTYKLKLQTELTVELEMCCNNVWRPAERQQESRQKGDPREREEASAKEVRGYYNSLLKQNTWSPNLGLAMKFTIVPRNYACGRSVLTIKTDKQGNFLEGKGKMGIVRFPRQTEGISTDRFSCFHKTRILDELPTDSEQELDHFSHWSQDSFSPRTSLMVWIVMLCVNCQQSKSSSLYSCEIEEFCLWHQWCSSAVVERFGQGTW